MGWIQDGAYDHEGWVANILDDGRAAGASTSGGVVVREVTGADEAAGYDIRAFPTGAREVVIPWPRVARWQVRCDCGWGGSSQPAVTNPKYNDRDWTDEFEEDFLSEWQAHVAPFVALSELGRLVDEHRILGGRIEENVRLARSAGASWSDVGRAAGLSKQGAQQRWGAATTRAVSR